jgi:anthranilate phosphoribosyltransferase
MKKETEMQIKEAIRKAVDLKGLTQEEAFGVAIEIMEGRATPAQISALLVALRMKGETIEEITGFTKAMREKATKVKCTSEYLVDTCGTGGDASGTFNISTVSAFVAAGAGCKIAKHCNRSISSSCGSADLLLALGINIDQIPIEKMARCIEENGIGFLFAPLLHKAMKYAIGPRREIGIRTIFNILGPLTNPAGAKYQLIGVYNKDLTEPIAEVLNKLEAKHCLIVHGQDGLDEITTTSKTKVTELIHGKIRNYHLTPEEFHIKKTTLETLKGGPPSVNAKIALDILNGKKGPTRDIVILNAAAVIYLSGKASSIKEGIKLAEESIDTQRSLQKLKRLKEMIK